MPLRRVDEAMAQFQMAVDADPNYAEAHFYLGAALRFMKGQPARALVHWRKVIELDPGHVPPISPIIFLFRVCLPAFTLPGSP